MSCCNAYESQSMRDALGDTLRPGGFRLTEKGVAYCGLSPSDRVLDLGCGRGATVNYLYEKHRIRAVGADPSEKLIGEARKRYGEDRFFFGIGENLPFDDESFSCVFAECTLSLMDTGRAIRQASRVLKKDGWLVITDVYARNPDATGELRQFAINSCMRGLHDLPQLKEKLQASAFTIVFEEDDSDLLKELLVKITFSCGSMNAFWNMTSQNCIDGCGFHEVLKKCRPGYFMLIARKGEKADG